MATQVKGLLKGLRYISHIFEEKEPELQIGLPTDVKHVAHIGSDGPSATTPSWMNGFQSAPEFASGPLNSTEISEGAEIINEITKTRHKSLTGIDSPRSSPTRRTDGSSKSKHSRRHKSTDATSDSMTRESSGSTRHGRRSRNSNLGAESPQQDIPAIPKHSRRRKSKGSSGSVSGRTSSSKGQHSMTDIQLDLRSGSENGDVLKNNE
ncbi:CRIB domain containing protein [Quillaja saponaria]|uniref:CRIB domain containing protein n=1 Tax=Quillaja saponaria TaxID=32244 RepID=A0AAD7LCC8_QUISA|nr:CRIB domain containing protein [Quillaja saponaria]